MESALTPREIQSRVREGQSAVDVANAAGVDPADIAVFVEPIIAERQFTAATARESTIRLRGSSASHTTLAEAVEAALPDVEEVVWDAWRDEDRQWFVSVEWGDANHAVFRFDARSHVASPYDDAARDLVGDPAPEPQPVPLDPDDEPTVDLRDEWAVANSQEDSDPPAVIPDARDTRDEIADYTPAELTEVDGVYDIIPNDSGDMDVLYDMLSGFNEDSVRIYTGMSQPVAPSDATEETQEPLVDAPEPPRKKKRKRASVPSWDEIMFGSNHTD